MGCTADAISYEATRFGQGLVTYAVLDGVRGPPLQKGEYVEVGPQFASVADAVPQLAGSLGGIQKPEFHSRGLPFAVGRTLEEDREKVPLGVERPMVLRPVLQDQDTGDRLLLSKQVRARVRALDRTAAREGGGGQPIVFVDVEKLTGALCPRASYLAEGMALRVRLVVQQEEQALRTADLTGDTDQTDDLVARIVEILVGAGLPLTESVQSPTG